MPSSTQISLRNPIGNNDMNAAWLRYLPPAFRSYLADRHNLQAVIGNSGWLLADKIVRGGLGLVITVWMARYLGPETFGLLNFAVAFVALFSAMASLGLDGIVVRELVRQPESKNEILGSALHLKLVGGGIAFILAVASIWHVRPADTQTHWLVSIIAMGMIFQAIDVADLWFQSQVQSRATVIAKDVAFLVFALIKVWLIWIHANVVAFAVAATGEILLGALNLFIVFQRTGNKWSYIRPAWARMTSLLSEGWPQVLAGLAVVLYSRIDQVMLAQMAGEREVGLYSAAIRISELWNFIPAIMVSSIMPSLTEYRMRSKDLYSQRLQQLYIVLARVAYTVAIPMTFLANPLIRHLYGESYSEAGLILAIHIWSGTFAFLGAATTLWSINEGTMKITFYQTILGAACNIALNLHLIPPYGALGSAVATIISYCFCAWLLNGCFVKTKEIFYMQTRALLAGVRK